MIKMSAARWALAASLLFAVSAFAQGNYKVESADAPSASDVPQALLDNLSAPGARVVGGQGAVCEVWLRKSIPTGESGGALGVLYGQLKAGTLLGVLHFPAQGADFRGQPVKAGYYTLRYALIPQDGAHMGVYQTRDAVVMSPVSADTDLTKELSFDEMVKLSREASGTPHPALLVMGEAKDGDFPSVVEDDSGFTNLQMKAHGSSGDLPIAITVVGKWEGM
jgi:hypothetical protein